MNEHDHVVFGSLLHDIGKFFERADMLNDHNQDKDKRQKYCQTKKKGALGFFHVLRTLCFCEKLLDKLPVLISASPEESNQNWIELACCHHDPSLTNDAYLKKIIQAADKFSSAERERGNLNEKGVHKKTRLESLLSKVNLNNTAKQKVCHYLPLAALSLEADSIYPKNAGQWDMLPEIKDEHTVWLTRPDALNDDYKKMAEAFLSDIEQLPHYAQQHPAALRSIVRTLLSLMEKYLSQVPASTNVLHPDISLFDHLRITAAIAQGLYGFHSDQNDLKSADFEDRQTKKWKLVCGDFSGIQSFIYKITSKGAAKGLRGRSFFIQLLCDATAEQLIRVLSLYSTARIYSSGGKFYILISETKLAALKREVENINQNLLQQFRGEVCLSIGTASISAEDFKEGNMGGRWKEANEDLMANRQQPFVAQVAEDIECFMPEALHAAGACQVCDRDDLMAGIQQEKEIRICKQCKELREIGRALADTHYLFWVWGKDRESVKNNKLRGLHRIDLCGTDCTVYFLKEKPELNEAISLYDCHLESLNIVEPPNSNPQGYSTGFRFVGQWQREKECGDFDFDDFAESAIGIKRMGVLRMDVDNLGEIFIRGLNFKHAGKGIETMGSLSRVATLSRQLNLFFCGFLSTLMAEFQRSQIIYAGGDDVFIIGSWDELPALSKKIRDEFKRYCGDNENFTLSGGIALTGGKYPISKAAELAGNAESQAKQLKRGAKNKDALSFLETSIGWESFDEALQFKDKICELTEKTNSHALIDRLRQVVTITHELKAQLPTPTTDIIYWNKWRWRLIYNLKRMALRGNDIEQDLEALQKKLLEPSRNNDQQTILDWLQIPVRWAEFLNRSDKRG